MCNGVFDKHDLTERFQFVTGRENDCYACLHSKSDHCLPNAIVNGQKPAMLFFGPRFSGVGTFVAFGIHPTEAFSSAKVDGILAPCDSWLARHSWMPEMATALSTGTIQQVVYMGQTDMPAAALLADPATANSPVYGEWYQEYSGVIELAERLYGPKDDVAARTADIARAIPVWVKTQLDTYMEQYFPNAHTQVFSALYDNAANTVAWVENPVIGSYSAEANPALHARFEDRRDAIADTEEETHDIHRIFSGCMDSRAIPSHVLGLSEIKSDAFVTTSMGGIWAPYDSKLARVTWIPEMAMSLEAAPHLREFIFMGHTKCAGAALVSGAPTADPLRRDWQDFYKATLIPMAQDMFGDVVAEKGLQTAIEKAIPVLIERNMRTFLDTHFAGRPFDVESLLYKMPEGNLHHLADAGTGEYTALTHNEFRTPQQRLSCCHRASVPGFRPAAA